ncbi:MAG: MbnP family protein, partial [Flavitalea sp.]
VVACQILITSCQKNPDIDLPDAQSLPVTLDFSAWASNDSLQQNQAYFNPFNEEIRVSAFKIYLHGFKFINTASGKSTNLEDKYYLVDLLSDASGKVSFDVPSGTYDKLRFTIGVDSVYNVSGAQEGVLDPGKGMFWTWNSGYIMAKLEGTSPESNVAQNAFEYHIGGFKGTNNVVKEIEVPLNAMMVHDEARTISLGADVNKWFSGLHDIRISETPVVIMPGPKAVEIAENYYRMFTVKSILQ